ncbi:uncharacterized protein LOC128956629 [Oppia nitens]|uniref:uncharacterized protein LOC128956629 n=1 Tax=Oppia nitens TaxID=1686743 RepID=UPI0023DCB5A2|nr:uncharacterized protein LOC128956629 [Oppia nitens]XP_054158322.1 uncharacterized protein LOC128956629 [Oppia nitens]
MIRADISKKRQFQRRLAEHREIRLGYHITYTNSFMCLTAKIMDTDGNFELDSNYQICKLNGQSIVSMDHLVGLLADCPNNQPINLSVRLIDDETALVYESDKTIQLMSTGLINI